MAAYVHGSLAEGFEFRDVDVALLVEDPADSLRYAVDVAVELSRELGYPVDCHVLNDAPLPFKHRVYSRGVRLLARGARAYEEENLAAREYFDIEMLNALDKVLATGPRGRPSRAARRLSSDPS